MTGQHIFNHFIINLYHWSLYAASPNIAAEGVISALEIKLKEKRGHKLCGTLTTGRKPCACSVLGL